MDHSVEVANIKTEPTGSKSSDILEISNEIQVESFKKESGYLAKSVIYIKTEVQENENMEKSEDEIIHDPLDVKTEDEEHSQIDLEDKLRIRTEPTENEKNKHVLKTDKDDVISRLNQDQLLIKDDSGHKDKKHICHVCHKTFIQKGDLDRHLRIHTGEKPFTCDVCEKSFNRKGNLDTHRLIHSGEKSHVCDICKKAFSRKSTLNDHKLIHRGEKPFTCKECNKSFTRKPHLVEHKRIHVRGKPFACDFCIKSFTHKSHLTDHKRIHTGEKPYFCDTCHKSFTQKPNLNYHKRIHKH